jgi:pimeloyl-ACP methyl ester carboxylesterase
LDPELDLGDEFREKPKGNTPTLPLSGSHDGRTYSVEQRQAVSELNQVIQVEVKHAGHNLFMTSPEVQERIEAFLSGNKVSTDTILLPVPNLSLK